MFRCGPLCPGLGYTTHCIKHDIALSYHTASQLRSEEMSTSSGLGATVQVTIDDFDPLFGYSNYYDWQTPDPSLNPSWYNASRDVTGMPWHEGESWMRTNLVEDYP